MTTDEFLNKVADLYFEARKSQAYFAPTNFTWYLGFAMKNLLSEMSFFQAETKENPPELMGIPVVWTQSPHYVALAKNITQGVLK